MRVIYTLDTNVVADALRQPAEKGHVKAFVTWALSAECPLSMVLAELAAGPGRLCPELRTTTRLGFGLCRVAPL